MPGLRCPAEFGASCLRLIWALEKRIRKDKKSTGVVANMTRSEAVFNILRLYYDGAVNLDELTVFSEELQAFVKHYIATFS